MANNLAKFRGKHGLTQEQLGENVIAAAGACAFANKLNNRPAVGVVYLGSKISFDKDNSMVYASHILLHELKNRSTVCFKTHNRKTVESVNNSYILKNIEVFFIRSINLCTHF